MRASALLHFAARQLLDGTAWIIEGDLSAASLEPDEPAHGPNSAGASIWYSWIAPENGWVTLAAGAKNFALAFAVD